MASLAREGTNRWRILFLEDGVRKTIRLPEGLDKRSAQTVKVKVENLLACKLANLPIPQDVATWLAGLSDDVYDRLARVGLVAARQRLTVAGFVSDWLKEAPKRGVKIATVTATRVGVSYLVSFFGDKKINEVSAEDATKYRDYLLAKGLRPATVQRRIGHARQVFTDAVRQGLVTRNPFQDMRISGGNPQERRHYVPLAEVTQIIAACPNCHWRLLVALSRFAGLRVPSEALSLRWQDVNWEAGRLRVPSPKTERAGKPYRMVPIFALLRPYLDEAWQAAQEGDDYIFPQAWRDRAQGKNGWINCNLRTQFLRIIKRAGLEPWPRPWHNMRASCESDLATAFPLAVVTRWLGNTPSVALQHYVDPTDDSFERAKTWTPSEVGTESGTAKRGNTLQGAEERTRGKTGSDVQSITCDNMPTSANTLDGRWPTRTADFHLVRVAL